MTAGPPSWDDGPISRWVEEIQAGRDIEENFARLYRHCHPRLIRFFSRLGAPPAAQEDLTQDTMFRVSQKIGDFERRSRFARWLYEIAHNIFRNDRRWSGAAKRDGYERPLVEEAGADEEDAEIAPQLASSAPSPFDETLKGERRAALRKALVDLPPQMQRCTLLRLGQDLKYREIAEVMQLSIDTVKAHLFQAKKQLQGKLKAGELNRLEEVGPAEDGARKARDRDDQR